MLIKTLNNKIIPIDVIYVSYFIIYPLMILFCNRQVESSNTTIRDMKRKIQNATGIPVNQQRLICHGIQLEDHRTVSDYNINDDTIVNLIHIVPNENRTIVLVSKSQ